LVVLRHTDAEWNEDLSDLPDSCRKEEFKWKLRKEVVARLAGIATRLWLASPCDRDLALVAAEKVVAQNAGKIRQILEASDKQIHLTKAGITHQTPQAAVAVGGKIR